MQDSLRQCKFPVVDDLKELDSVRLGIAVFEKSAVYLVFQNPQDVIALEFRTAVSAIPFLIYIGGNLVRPASFRSGHTENPAYKIGFYRFHGKVAHFLSLLVLPPILHERITVGNGTAGVDSFFRHLLKSGLHTDGCFLGFTGCLPEADIVHEFVYMVLEFLLTFIDRPYFNVMLCEPLKNERCFILDSAETVEHEDEKNVEFMGKCRFLQVLNGVALFGGYLEPGDSLFLEFPKDFPIGLSFGEFVAGDSLHGNVIFGDVHLLYGRYSV